jgi:hypothetical protein
MPRYLLEQVAGSIQIAGLATIQTQSHFGAFPAKTQEEKPHDLH